MNYEKKEFIEDLNELLIYRYSDITKDIKYFLLEIIKVKNTSIREFGIKKKDFEDLKKKHIIVFLLENLRELSYEDKLSIVKILVLMYLYEYNCCIDWITSQLRFKDTRIAKKYLTFNIERDKQEKELQVRINSIELKNLNLLKRVTLKNRANIIKQLEKKMIDEVAALISTHKVKKTFTKLGRTFERDSYMSKEDVFNILEKKAMSPYMLIKHRISDEVLVRYNQIKLKNDNEVFRINFAYDKKLISIENEKNEIIKSNTKLMRDIND